MHKNSSYSCVNTSLVQKNSKAVHQFAASSIGEMYEMLSGEWLTEHNPQYTTYSNYETIRMNAAKSTVWCLSSMLKRSSSELPFQSSEVATFSSQTAVAASSCSNEPYMDTWVPVPGHTEPREQEMERIWCLPLTTACRLKIPCHYHLLQTAQHTVRQSKT